MTNSFDRAADYYDQTRGYPGDMQERVGRELLNAAGATPDSRILEMGVGTGRIALPIIRAGYPYTGIDISPRMMDRLRAALENIPGARERVTLVEGDITRMPFASGSFDIVLTTHVYHLIPEREQALKEELRVLARPGVVLNGVDESSNDPGKDFYLAWEDILRGLGYVPRSRGERRAAHYVGDDWRRLGGEVDVMLALESESSWIPERTLKGLENRIWSSTWSIPDEIYPEALKRLRAWAEQHYGADLRTAFPTRSRFLIERGRFS